MKEGIFVISLDFELMWGIIDVHTKDEYGQTNVKRVPDVIRRLIALFEKYDVHATFATVGMIMYPNAETLLGDLPNVFPTYINSNMSPYENNYIPRIKSEEECLFFQQDLVKEIHSHRGMEIGTHTFCHYYCWAEGQDLTQFETDLAKAVEVAEQNGFEIKSIVFPRNQMSDEYLKVCSECGIESYRGNSGKYFNNPKNKMNSIKDRLCRLMDAYINIGGYPELSYDELQYNNGVLNVQASRMLRPYIPTLSFFENIRLRRIKKEMEYAAKHGRIYHLWWHPHNFGANMDKNFEFLEKLLKHYKYCHEKYGMISMNMQEVTQLVKDIKES